MTCRNSQQVGPGVDKVFFRASSDELPEEHAIMPRFTKGRIASFEDFEDNEDKIKNVVLLCFV